MISAEACGITCGRNRRTPAHIEVKAGVSGIAGSLGLATVGDGGLRAEEYGV